MPELHSLKARLALWILFPTILIALIDLVASYYSADRIATLVQDQLLKGSARIISEQLATVDGGYEISIPPAAFELFANSYQDRVFYSVRTKSGLLIAGDPELAPYAGQLRIEEAQYTAGSVRGESVRIVAYKHALPSTVSSDFAVTQIAQGMSGHHAFRSELFAVTMRQHFLLLVIVSCALFVAFRWTLSPLIDLGHMLDKRQPGTLQKIDPAALPSELTPIADALNDYVARLDATLGTYERFVANTAHHLRTSFAIILSQVNFGMRDKDTSGEQRAVLNAIQDSVRQGSKTINQLLVLASLDSVATSPSNTTPSNIAAETQTVIETLAPLAQSKSIALEIDRFEQDLWIAVATHLLREVVSNLIDNAIRHTPIGGTITVSVFVQANSAAVCTAVVRVADSGPGIALQHQHNVFERFYRIDNTAVDSSGLGLAIVKEICDAHHGAVALSHAVTDTGLVIEAAFPTI